MIHFAMREKVDDPSLYLGRDESDSINTAIKSEPLIFSKQLQEV